MLTHSPLFKGWLLLSQPPQTHRALSGTRTRKDKPLASETSAYTNSAINAGDPALWRPGPKLLANYVIISSRMYLKSKYGSARSHPGSQPPDRIDLSIGSTSS